VWGAVVGGSLGAAPPHFAVWLLEGRLGRHGGYLASVELGQVVRGHQ